MLALACGPANSTTVAPASVGGGPGGPAASKTLYMAMQGEPDALILYGRPAGSTTPYLERWFMFHANLTMYSPQGDVIPHAARKVPSVQDGDWKLLPDGSMEVTWRIRADIFWHDGTPLTAEDFVFGFDVVRDPRLSVLALGELRSVSSVSAPDDHTLVVTWRQASIYGNVNAFDGVPPLPRHLIRDLYIAGDMAAFENNPIWTTQWVGVGPYRLTEWMPGTHIDAAAFDQYFMGRPKIDRVVIRHLGDVNIMMAHVLSGTVDVAPLASMLKPDQIVEIRRSWASTDGGQAYTYPNAIRTLWIQWRDPAAPWVQDLRVRQAMMHSLNRDSLNDALQFGLTTIAHYYVMPEDPIHQLAEQRQLPRYGYDAVRAERLFAEAGWTRGADRLLRNSAGQTITFECCRLADADPNDIRESQALVGELQAAGFQARHPIPTPSGQLTAEDERRLGHAYQGGYASPFRFSTREGFAIFTPGLIATQENRWQGQNRGGWTTPAYQDLFTKAVSTFDPAERQEPLFQMTKMIAEELPVLPIYYNPLGIAIRKGVDGPGPVSILQLGTTWNIHTWDIR
jgi:peptide/nickel transport system substrate-binding protein